MNCSSSKTYEFSVRDKVTVPRSQYRYAGTTLYKKNGENSYSAVSLPSDLYTNVPSSVSYEDVCEVTLEIDGNPYERSVHTCSDSVSSLNRGIEGLTEEVDNLNDGTRKLTKQVNKLTGSTAAAAVGISGAKIDAANVIAGSLSRGFSKYIGYLIRERLTELRAKLPSTASTFKALSDNLGKRQEILGRDYERISDRYSKIFVKLEEELRSRLLELDRPAFENCAQMQTSIFMNPFGYILGQSVCSGAEQLLAADAVRVSRLKGTAEAAMVVMKEYVQVIKRLSASVSGVLANRKIQRAQTLSMPVIRMVSDDVVTKSPGNVRTFIPKWFENSRDMGFGNSLSATIEKLPTIPKDRPEIEIMDGCFMKRFSSWVATEGRVDSRVTEKILALWETAKSSMCN